MRWEQTVSYAAITDIGLRRKNNQDSLCVLITPERETWAEHGHLLMVADGMGGHAVGELASKIAADTVPHTFYKSKPNGDVVGTLKSAVEQANAAIYERGSQNRDFERMGTTCSVLALTPSGAVIGHVGDSRVYRIRDDRIDQLTFDHSLQWELLRQGNMKPEDVLLHEPRHVITRSLGPEPTVQVDAEGPFPILPGDTFVLCSDGLTGHVGDAEIGAIGRALPPGEAARLLVHMANLRGGSDNCTVIVARVGELPPGAPPVDRHEPSGHAIGWGWLFGFWAAAAGFVGGVSMMLFGKLIGGAVIAALSVSAAVAMLVALMKRRREFIVTTDGDAEKTRIWRPYRTANAGLTRKFLSRLAAVQGELQSTAAEEGWKVDWDGHAAAFQAAKAASDAGRNTEALSKYAEAVDYLMSGLQEYRKQLSHEKKWGKKPVG